jgi:pyruvate/2-oxoglutarate dehydrogenase complex dihydrolipoamide dehydrogenase (E3) component
MITAQTEHFDVVVLGSGQGGKQLAWHHARSGRKVAVVAMPFVGRTLGRGTDAQWVIAAGLLTMAAGNHWMSQMNLDISPRQARLGECIAACLPCRVNAPP